jgi:spore germination protein YaaH/PKD repeat protein
MKKVFFTPFLLVLVMFVSAQEHKSIHQQQLEYYSQFNAQTPEEWAAIRGACKPNNRIPNKSCTLNKIVFGWHPYWSNGLEANYDWSLISDLSYFCYTVDAATGNATTTNSWSTANVVTQALSHGVRVNLCVTLFSNHATFFGSSSAQQTLINNLISLVQARGANGVNIDFEGLPSSQKTNFTNFMMNLCNAFHSQISGSQVSVCLYAVDWSTVFDIATLKDYIDLFCIMGYDYYYGGSTTAGPSSPLYSLTSSYDYNVTKSITYYLAAGVPANKLVLGLPYYGEEWATSASTVPSSATGTGSSKIYNTVRNNSSGYYTPANWHFNTNSYVPYFAYNNGSSWYQCWIDNAYSLGKKMELVWKRGIAGIGIWALGYDDGYPDLWNKISEKLTTCFTNACQDTIYDMGGPAGNYYNKENYSYTIQPAGASTVTLNFQSFDVEANYDSLWLYDGPSTTSPLIGAYTGTNSPGSVTTTQPAITLKFKSDNATTNPGFTAYWQCNTDNIAPTTLISTQGTWKTQNYTANFTDADNNGGSGLEKSYYSVNDYNGTEWRANNNNGFFNDNFNTTLSSDWLTADSLGAWNVSNGYLNQTYTGSNKTRLSVPVLQDSNHVWLYHWQMAFNPGSTRRAGIYIMASDPTQSYLGSAYLIWFRADDDKCEIYYVKNNTMSGIVSTAACTINDNIFYDYKVTYNPATGVLKAFQNNILICSYTDTLPLKTAGYLSLRTGNASVMYDNLEVYKSRGTSAIVTVGAASTNDIRYQNPNPTTPSAKIKSIVVDVNNNMSSIVYENENIDWTPPTYSGIVADGLTNDVDTISSTTSISANWQAFDEPNSGIAEYWYSVGTQAGDSNTVMWTNNNTNTYFTANAGLQAGIRYYVNVKAKNNAGLWSTVKSSDGVIVLPNGNLPLALFSVNDSIICSGNPVQFNNQSISADSILWIFMGGTPSHITNPNPAIIYNNAGTFDVTLIAYNVNGTDTLIKHNYVTVQQSPVINVSYHVISTQAPYYVVFDNQSQYVDSVLWNFGDGQTGTDLSPYHIYTSDGQYIVVMQAKNAHCISTYTDTLNLGPSLAETMSYSQMTVFPNPAEDKIIISSPVEKIVKIELLSMDGRCLKSMNISANKAELSIKEMDKGIYLLKIKTMSNKLVNFKLLKK